ncbi:hypothetical protein C8Q76DRAFT_731339 [Earliella scabrosa]|nr:hypothetical protein C8Q76DRAFT_731339 [Earliella scabrosa]
MHTTDDAVIWRMVGHDLVQSFVAVTVETLLLGIYLVLVFKTTTLLLGNHRTRVSLLTCTALLVMFTIALVLWIIDIHGVIVEVQIMLLGASSSRDVLEEAYSATVSRIARLASIQNVLYAYLTNIGDGVIIWRVYAFWSRGRERLILVIPVLCLLGAVASSMALTVCAARLGGNSVLWTYQTTAFCRGMQTASYSTALATSAVATLLIAYKSWTHRTMQLEAFGKSVPHTRTRRIMVFLVESGILYVLFFLIQVILSLESVNERISRNVALTLGFTIYEFSCGLIVGMYPTLGVLVVNSKRSMPDTISVPDRSISIPSGSLYIDTRSRSRSTYPNTNTSVPTRAEPNALDLYEMVRLKSSAVGNTPRW